MFKISKISQILHNSLELFYIDKYAITQQIMWPTCFQLWDIEVNMRERLSNECETKEDTFWTCNNDSIDLQGDCGLHLPNKDNYKGM